MDFVDSVSVVDGFDKEDEKLVSVDSLAVLWDSSAVLRDSSTVL